MCLKKIQTKSYKKLTIKKIFKQEKLNSASNWASIKNEQISNIYKTFLVCNNLAFLLSMNAFREFFDGYTSTTKLNKILHEFKTIFSLSLVLNKYFIQFKLSRKLSGCKIISNVLKFGTNSKNVHN